MHTHFISIHPNDLERNPTSLSVRWKQVQKAVNKFCGVFAQVETRNESGKTFEDKVRDAMTLYQDVVGSPFTMFGLWTILKTAKKWQDIMEGKERRIAKRKTSLTIDEIDGAEDEDEGESGADVQGGRPLGRKKAKKMVKEERHSASLLESSSVMAESSREMIELTKKKVMALELISQEKIMSKDLATLNEKARMFYELQQDKILKKIMEQDK